MLAACRDEENEMVHPLASLCHESNTLNNKEANNGTCVVERNDAVRIVLVLT